MPTKRIKPFLASYYNRQRFKSLKKLVCPPYDVISKSEHKKLLKASKYNYAHILIKGKNSSYQDLGKKFKQWFRNNVLVEDKTPAFYVTLQEFKINSKKFQRRGFIGLLKLDEKKVVFPHEHTHSRPKKDRAQVLSSVKANLSPIFLIYPKKNTEPLAQAIAKLKRTKPFFKLTDSKKITYKIWRLLDKREIEKITGYFKKIPLLIADGHHRFEVACDFLSKNKAKSHKFKDLNYILAYFSPQDKDLLILPTQRVLKKRLDLDLFKRKLSPYFAIRKLKTLKELKDYLAKPGIFSFGFLQDKNIFSLSLKDKKVLAKIYKRNNPYTKLDTFLLHKWVFARLLKLKIKEDQLVYAKSISQARIQAQELKGCSFIIRSSKIKDIMKVAFRGLKLPQKTTYFYPKFLSGPILRKL